MGGSHVKALATGQSVPRRMDSGPRLDAATMVRGVKDMTADWEYDVVSLGYPGQVIHNLPAHDPANLGHGWIGFDYAAAFGRPTRVINDAAMQALGSYHGGRMLFIGVGTGLGSAMIVDGQLEPMELGHLVYKHRLTYEDYVGERGLLRLGKKAWRKEVYAVIEAFRTALQPEYIILGGGNARLVHKLPHDVELGNNANAFIGGFRLWEDSKAAPGAGPGDTPSPFAERIEMVTPVPEGTAYDEAG